MADSNEDQRSNISFEELAIPIGTILNLESAAPARKYVVHLAGYVPGRSLMVTPPLRDGKEQLLEKDIPLACRLLEGKSVCAFETKVLYRSVQPYSYYHLEYPQAIETQQVRSAERVDTSIDAEIDSDFNIIGDWPKFARIKNLSRTGAKLSSFESLGEYGHELFINFDLDVSGMGKRICLGGVVRNIERIEEDDLTEYVIGVQFLEMSDEARLALANYIYEHDRH